MMSITNMLTLACTATVAGIIATQQMNRSDESSPEVNAYLGGNADVAGQADLVESTAAEIDAPIDLLAELKREVEARKLLAAEDGPQFVLPSGVTADELAVATRDYHARIENARRINERRPEVRRNAVTPNRGPERRVRSRGASVSRQSRRNRSRKSSIFESTRGFDRSMRFGSGTTAFRRAQRDLTYRSRYGSVNGQSRRTSRRSGKTIRVQRRR